MRATKVAFFREVILPVHRFIRTEWTGSVFLLFAAVVALVWTNSPWTEGYELFWTTPFEFRVGGYSLTSDYRSLVNDGVMAFFFFVIGLEVKRDVLHGTLSTWRTAALPALGAVGGMVLPAALYLLVAGGGVDARGWGIPMATDIAFALAVMGLVGARAPVPLRIFILALAIVDDLGAILIIAIFYTETVRWGMMGLAGLILLGVLGMQKLGVRNAFMYTIVGGAFWLATLESGIHPTIAGVILAFITPARAYFDRDAFPSLSEELLEHYETALAAGHHSEAQAVLGKLEELAIGTEAPLERLERRFHTWSSLLALPLFALANAGVHLSAEALGHALAAPVTLGVVLGLTVGKPVGILATTWIGVRLGVARLPDGVRWLHIAGAGVLAGIGFTVSLFITELAFRSPERTTDAMVGILTASIVAGALGYLILRLAGDAPPGLGMTDA